MDIDCDAGDDRCNQMHLLKGDACYVLGRRAEAAEQDSTARVRFECAETHLGTGIEKTEANAADWTVAGKDRTQWYTNRAESLRQLQDLQSGNAARAVSKALLDFGRAFRDVDLDAAAPYFYIATARYALVQPQLIDAQPGDADICDELNGIRRIASTIRFGAPRTNRTTIRRTPDRECSDLRPRFNARPGRGIQVLPNEGIDVPRGVRPQHAVNVAVAGNYVSAIQVRVVRPPETLVREGGAAR
jgi:hypothetical protein